MTGPKLNEAPVARRSGLRAAPVREGTHGTKAVAKYVRISPYKVREVLDLIRGQDIDRARDILKLTERDAAITIAKVLNSAVANAEHNDGIGEDELYVSACFADEGPTLKRWRPRARGRATRIRKRTCHITVLVSRLPEQELATRRAAGPSAARAARRAGEQRRRLGRRRAEEQVAVEEDAPVEETVAAADETLADEPVEVQEAAAEQVAEAGVEVEAGEVEAGQVADADVEETAVTPEQVVAEQDDTGATQEEQK